MSVSAWSTRRSPSKIQSRGTTSLYSAALQSDRSPVPNNNSHPWGMTVSCSLGCTLHRRYVMEIWMSSLSMKTRRVHQHCHKWASGELVPSQTWWAVWRTWFLHKRMHPTPQYRSSSLMGLLLWTCCNLVLLKHFPTMGSHHTSCLSWSKSAEWMSCGKNNSPKVWRPKHAAREGREFIEALGHPVLSLKTGWSFSTSMTIRLNSSPSWQLMWQLLTQTNK